jgi:hypothetical protein
MSMNNIDMVAVNSRAMLLLEQVFLTPPYDAMSPDE